MIEDEDVKSNVDAVLLLIPLSMLFLGFMYFPPKRNKVDRFFLFVQCFGKDQVERIGSVMKRYAVKMSKLASTSTASCSGVKVGKW